MKKIKLARINLEKVANEIGDFIIKEVTSIGKNGCVVGLSGGVDSTTTAALAKRTFDMYNAKNSNKLELVGYMLPSKTNSQADTEDGIKVAEKIGIRYEVRNIEDVIKAFETTNPDTLESRFHKGNLMAEIRAVVLHAKAATENKLMLGTGNRDEDFGVAYYTLFGDGAVHLSPIGNLPKRLVREMACYLGFEKVANRVPSAGLEPGQTDFKDLGYGYDLVEIVFEGLRQGFSIEELARHEQVNSAAEKDIKTYEKIYNCRKFNSASEIVYDILRRNKIAGGKARIIHPPAAEISLKYK